MAQKDLNEKVLVDYNDVFSDIFNTLLFRKPFICDNQLESGPTESIYKSRQGDPAAQVRDIYKNYNCHQLCICSLGIENQSQSDPAMPIRIMGYDYAAYRDMFKNEQPLHPVTTIVLNFSNKKWNSAKSIHELLHLPDDFIPYVEDYKIRVYDIAFLSDNVIEQFTSDFKSIARFFKDRRLGIDTLKNGDLGKVRHAEAVLDLLAVFTKDNRYRKLYTEAIKEQEKNKEEIDMCWMLQGWIDEGMEKGIEKGLAEGLERGLSACVAALKMTGLSFEKVFETITSTEPYTTATHEQILNYYNQ